MNILYLKNIFAFEKIKLMLSIFFELIKLRLSLLVTFSALFGYVLASSNTINYDKLFFLFLGGFLITSSSVINNQILEKDSDALMNRTKGRPIPTKRISIKNSLYISVIFTFLGFSFLVYFLNLLIFQG